MEPSEEISVIANPSEQPQVQGDADPGLCHSPSSPNADPDPDPAASDLEPSPAEYAGGLHDQLRSLGLKESEEASRSDSGDKEEEGRDEEDLSGGEIENREEGEGEEGSDDKKENENETETENENGVNNGGGEADKKNSVGGGRKYQYPVRPEAEDCSFYLKTGNCKFGSNCKFNHPVRRKNNQEKAKEREESTEKTGQSECKFYLRSGGCKFGKACKYNHSRGKTSVVPATELNFVGLPIRLGEKECPYYMRTGSCKYGTNCRFNHPDPTDAAGETSAGYGNGGPVPFQGGSQSTIAPWCVPRPPLNEAAPAPAPFVPMMIPPNQGVPSQNAEWNGYQAPVYLPDRTMPPPPAYIMNNRATETNIYPHHPPQKQADEYPERPGQPECSYFLKTGDCKFKSNCKYHHPKKGPSMSPPCALSDKGLPLRPDQNPCTYYSRYGICKFGPGCKYDHSVQPNSAVSGVDNQPPFSNAATMEGAGIARSGSRSESTIQQSL